MKMGSRAKKKVKVLPEDIGDEDRISRLPNELIHKIQSFLDAKVAVQTSILSRRWKPVWTSLPFLNFGPYDNSSPKNVNKFIRHVLSNRNHQSHLSELNICVYNKGFSKGLRDKFVEYAISHNVQSLRLELLDDHKPFKLSTFSSKSLKKLKLSVYLQLESDCWELPALTTLHLSPPNIHKWEQFPDSWFTCLPALRTLCLAGYLFHPSFFLSFPALTTLDLSRCTLQKTVWDFPNLSSLLLDGVDLPHNMNDIFAALVNLKNLTLCLSPNQHDHFISCPPQLLNLTIRTGIRYYSYYGNNNVVVSAPRLRNFTSFGIFSATIGVPELENVNIRLKDWFGNMDLTGRKRYHQRLTNMLPGLGNAKNLTFDLDSIEALNEISNLLVNFSSPFHKLKYVILPMGSEESSISSALRSYLLGSSPKATIITKLPQNHGVGDFMVDADRVRHIDASVEGTDKDQASSLSGEIGSRLWRGHEVNSEFVCLLDRIMHKYPDTFEHFTTKNKKLCTMNLNMLCTSVNDFIKISMTDVDSQMIVAYKDIFSYLENQGFNVSWMVNRLNYIEHLRFSKPLIDELQSIDCDIDDAKTELKELQARADDARIKLQDLLGRVDDANLKLQDVQTLRAEKLTEIEKAFGTMGTTLAVGFIGNDLLCNP